MRKINYNLILASQSPRRQYLLNELGLKFETRIKDVPEIFDSGLKREEIPLFLSGLKAEAFKYGLGKQDLVITADTIVWISDQVLNKPHDIKEAKNMLEILSGKMHEVITGVTLTSREKQVSFYNITKVYFKNLHEEEIDYYLAHFKPLDKAGAYGIQEWIGYIGIEKIDGSYFNVMGLPVKELYENLLDF